VDLLVFGAGAGGMTAALVAAHEGLRVLLCEKTGLIGGTTATSGGSTWVPGTRHAAASGAPDTIEAARKYLDGEVGGYGARDLRETFFATGSEAIDYLDRNTEVKFKAQNPYPDYHAEAPGGAFGGRTLTPLVFDGRLLGADFALVRPPVPEFMVLGGMMVARNEIKHLIRPWSSLTSLRIAMRNVGRYLLDRIRYPRGTRLILGNALVARMLYSLRRAKAEIAVNTGLVEVIRSDGIVQGALVDFGGKRQRIRALRGVVLATGGCAASAEWQARLAPGVPVAHTLAFEGNSGDGLAIGERAGGGLDTNHSTPFFWMPASVMHWSSGRVATYPHIRDRPKPGLIAVNAAGKRFVNEGNSYHDFVDAMFRTHATTPTIPAYLICDRAFVHNYGIGVIHPVWQRLSYFERRNYLVSAPTLGALAAKIGVDPEGLAASVREHNQSAESGVDTAFGKGSKALNRHNGDPAHKPNPCLGPIATAPFFAVRVFPAPIGSSAGLRTNGDGQVLDRQGAPIEGLYACGNDMSSIMGGFYPGPGVTIGPAVVFAYRVAKHAASQRVLPVAATV
jgi:succinate dehydrogenase/fumarate reductase flavoprotein subunit